MADHRWILNNASARVSGRDGAVFPDPLDRPLRRVRLAFAEGIEVHPARVQGYRGRFVNVIVDLDGTRRDLWLDADDVMPVSETRR